MASGVGLVELASSVYSNHIKMYQRKPDLNTPLVEPTSLPVFLLLYAFQCCCLLQMVLEKGSEMFPYE